MLFIVTQCFKQKNLGNADIVLQKCTRTSELNEWAFFEFTFCLSDISYEHSSKSSISNMKKNRVLLSTTDCSVNRHVVQRRNDYIHSEDVHISSTLT